MLSISAVVDETSRWQKVRTSDALWIMFSRYIGRKKGQSCDGPFLFWHLIPPPSIASQIIILLQLHTPLPQDGVGCCQVEIEIGQGEFEEVVLARHFVLGVAARKNNLLVFAAIKGGARNAFDKFQGEGDALFEGLETVILAVEIRHGGARQAARGTHRKITGGAHLLGQRPHIGMKPKAQ